MVSGSDVHGTPITVLADGEGVEPQAIVDRYHAEFITDWEKLGISWDLYTSTGTPNHYAVTQDVFSRLLEKGYITEGASTQFFDPKAKRFLPDRYVEGTCPHCGYQDARGDQCDDCGRTLDAIELIEPRSKMSDATPVTRETKHYFLRLDAFSDRLSEWLSTRKGWRRHVKNWAMGMVNEGLPERAITRDLLWGVPLPPPADQIGEGKRIYVWFDAVIGYLSAAKEWSQIQGTPQAWKRWWEDPTAESYYFIGKDNIPFHAVIWPAMLMGYGGLNLPTDVPANQYVTFRQEKASSSRGIGRSVGWYANRIQADALRYALGSALPEQNDTDFSDSELVRRVNDELVATWGNLVHRVLSMAHGWYGGRLPESRSPTAEDLSLLAAIDRGLESAGQMLERVELRAGLRQAMEGAQAVNVYLNAQAPWLLRRQEPDRAEAVLATALSAINGLKVAFSPYLPFSSEKIHAMLGQPGTFAESGWRRSDLRKGKLHPPQPLFEKLDENLLE
jgi:methionyl-tRNA synthetase